MTRVHDMGGRYGDGPVRPEHESVRFHADWHPRALALVLAAGTLGQWNIDMSRRARENLGPVDYPRFAYYEKWLAALADLLVETGVVSRDELAGAEPTPSALADRALQPENVGSVLTRGGPSDRPSDIAPRFEAGDTVQTRRISASRIVDGGHTRLPAYAAGARGRILRCHGAHVLPDSSAHGLGDAAEPLYAIAFPAAELWSHPEHPRDEVVLDLWQSYLEPR